MKIMKKIQHLLEIILTENNSAFKTLTTPKVHVFFISLMSSEFKFNNDVLRTMRLQFKKNNFAFCFIKVNRVTVKQFH